MELRTLRYFLIVAREENITKAASLLHVTQPTLSRQLMQLEDELGVKLFKRSNHSIILTDEGMLLRRRAQELVALADKTQREFSHEGEQLSGEIAIGSGELHSVDFLSDLLAAFQKEHPLVSYEIYSGNADSIKERIEKGLLDLGLLLEPVDIGKYAFTRMPVKEQWSVLARKDGALWGKETATPADLAGIPLLMTARTLVQNELANWFGAHYDSLTIAATFNLVYNAAILVKNGMGTAICLKLDCEFPDLRFIPLSPSLTAGSVLAWKKNQTLSPTTAAFIEYAKKYINSISVHAT